MKRIMHSGILALLATLFATPALWAQVKEAIQDLQEDVRYLKVELERLKREMKADRLASADQARRIEDRLDRITRVLEKMSEGSSVVRSTSGFGAVAPATPGVGTLRLRNTLAVEAQVTINGVTYAVPANNTAEVRNLAAGAFSYELTATGYSGMATYRTTIAANETLTVTIR